MGYQASTPWSKLRFDWKKRVNRSQNVSRGAKCLASFLCDEYVGRDSGRCWPANATIALAMGVSKRTVQRYLSELNSDGWISYVAVRNRRRTIQITMPDHIKGDNKGDRATASNMTVSPLQRDTAVIPYKNQVNNQVKTGQPDERIPAFPISEDEGNLIEGWKGWVKEHTHHDPASVFKMLRSNGSFWLPSRYPKDGEVAKAMYVSFFNAVMLQRNSMNT
jgi:hypothetical protein